MRFVLMALALLSLTTDASAACRCACVRGMMRPICQQTDLVEPICAGICTDDLRPEAVLRPLAGGKQEFDVVRPANPSPGGLVDPDIDLNANPNGYQLGTAGVGNGNGNLTGSSAAGGAAGR